MKKMQSSVYKKEIGYSLLELKVTRTFVNETLQKMNVSDNDINMITLSIDEVCANLIIHAQHLKVEDKIEISLTKENGGIWVNILDHGISFNPINFKEKSLEALVLEKKKGGIGLVLVNKIMDKIEYHIEETYNVCSMFKNITAGC